VADLAIAEAAPVWTWVTAIYRSCPASGRAADGRGDGPIVPLFMTMLLP
jgi:hypothetical protein